MSLISHSQINPMMIQQGVGTIMGLKNKVGEMKNATSACRFGTSDGNFVYSLMQEYNKEEFASGNNKYAGGKVKSGAEIKSRAEAGKILGEMGNWSTTDYTSDELARINKLKNNSACAGQAVQVLGGMKDQILGPLLGQIAPGMGGMLGGGGLGDIGGMLNGLTGGGQ